MYPETAGTSAVHVPAWFRSVCGRLGMSSKAPDGWALIHVKPHVACMCCLLATIAATGVTAVYAIASQPYRWFHHSTVAACFIIQLTLFGILWRGGPLAADTLLAKGCLVATLFTNVSVTLLMLLGPQEQCIFEDRLALTFVNALFVWCATCAAFWGNWAPDRPKTPYRYVHGC